MSTQTTDLTTQLADQLDFHWNRQLRGRLDGLTDDEYFWKPVDGCWTVHRDGTVDFEFPSVEEAAQSYADDFGPFLMARAVLEPQGRWDEFLEAFTDLIRRFNAADDGTARIRSDYLLIGVER